MGQPTCELACSDCTCDPYLCTSDFNPYQSFLENVVAGTSLVSIFGSFVNNIAVCFTNSVPNSLEISKNSSKL